MEEKLSVELALMLDKFNRNLDLSIRKASDLDKGLKELITTSNKVEARLNKLKGDIKINLDVDTGAVGRAENDIQALDNLSPKIDVTVNVDEEQAQSELKSLTAPDLRVMVTADEEQAQSELNSLTAPDLKVQATADLSNVEKQLNDIKNLAKIQLVFDVAGAGLNVAQNVQNLPIVSGAQELDATLKEMQATTGKVIPDAEKLINDVFSSGNWGATREEVGGVIAELSKFPGLNDDLVGSATTAFQVMQVTGTDLEGTIDSLRGLVANGLAPDVQSAGDLIVTTFQRGGDVAGDAIDTIREYSSQWAQAGIDGAAATDLIIQGLQLGTRDGDKLADTFKELGIRLTTAVDDMAGAEFDAVMAAGLFDEAKAVQAGEMTGLAFAEAALAALESGEATTQNLFDIFGTPLEDFGIDIFKQLDFSQAAEAIIPEGAAEEAANLLNDNLSAAAQNFGRVMETAVIKKLEAAGIDINEFLQGATDKLYNIAELIGDGVAFPDAIAIALENPELGEQLRKLESILGNFIIELLTGVANLGEALKLDVSGIREFVADAGATQLAYDITVDPENMAHVEFAIEQALRRGVDSDIIGEQVARAGQALIDRGDLEGAQQLLETVESIPAAFAEVQTFVAGIGGVWGVGEKIIVPIEPEIADDPEAIAAKVDAVVAEMGAAGRDTIELDVQPTVDTTALEGLLFGVQSDLGETATNWMDSLVDFADTNLTPPLSDQDAVNLAAGALAVGDIATAMDAAQRAGWPIDETNVRLIGEASNDFYVLHGKLTEYTLGLQDAKTDGTKALQDLKDEGIDVVIGAHDRLVKGMDAYVLGVQGGLEIAKVSWQDYLDWLEENGLVMYEDGSVGVPMAPSTSGANIPSHALGTTNTAGGLALLHPGEAVLPPDVNAALNSVLRFYGMGGGITNNSNMTNIYVNVTNNNANQAAAVSGADRLSANIRGF